jgi:hypothetical protein
MYHLQTRRQHWPNSQWPIGFRPQFFDYRITLASEAEQKPHAQLAQSLAPKPGYQWSSLRQSTYADPCNNIFEKSLGVRQSQRNLQIGTPFAQTYQEHSLISILQEPFGNDSGVSSERTKTFHGNEFDRASHRFAYGHEAGSIGAAAFVFAIKGARNDAD